MPLMTPDPTFYPSPGMATQSPPERLAYLSLVNPRTDGRADAIGVVDLDPGSSGYGRLVGQTDMPHTGDELHHFGWNACSSCLCPYAPHPHMERRYLVVPGLRSSRIHILDTKPDPRQPQIVKVIEPETLAQRTGYAAPHTVHCGPDGIFVSALGAPDGNGPGGTFILDPETFDIRGRWEIYRGPQRLMYDIWWHLGLDMMVTSTWGTPNMVKDGVNPELLLGGEIRQHAARLGSPPPAPPAGAETRRRAADGRSSCVPHTTRPAPTGSSSVVLSLKDLSSSIWLWYRDTSRGKTNGSADAWAIKKVIEIPAEPADPENLPPLLQGFKAAAPLVTDINLSIDDRYLYVSCFGHRRVHPVRRERPVQPARRSARSGSAAWSARAGHPGRPGQALNGGPQMVEVSRDGGRASTSPTVSTRPWDDQFYPDGVRDGWPR